ncbi:MAG: sulfatase-like hydrolase/transferase, partial [Bdellovibrionaceae bacterium]|nr:sulfatase-like hydrolase/transferase [Pseudobdellovibrionaceae bacterium]
MGFETFYGSLAAKPTKWAPLLVQDNRFIETPKRDGYHLTEDLVDRTISGIRDQQQANTGRPFFAYLAFGANHAPLHAPKPYIEKYKGKFDQGWDKVRGGNLRAPEDARGHPGRRQLTARPKEIPGWDDMPEAFKPVLRREMEVYAGFLEHTDYQVGRIVDTLEKLGILENTLIYYIVGDNGASAEGGINGSFNEMSYFNGLQSLETAEYLSARIDKLGGPESYNHYAVSWAHAMNTPFQWTKQVASHFGGTRNGMVVHWPKKIKGKGDVRSQFGHVIDVAPTILEVRRICRPKVVKQHAADPMEGTSLVYTFDDAKA